MTENKFYGLLQRRLSQISVGASSIRKQGSGGLIKTLRNYFQVEVDLVQFTQCLTHENDFNIFLDNHTTCILNRFPSKAQSWGAARKGLNLFLREIVYSKFFSHRFLIPENFNDFNSFVKFMEVPLDKDVATGLIAGSIGELPRWNGIKNLTQSISDEYQRQASLISIKEGIARINLDLKYWRPEQ